MSADDNLANPPPRRDRRTLVLGAAAAALLIFALLFEGFCQIYARLVVFPSLEALRQSDRHFYRASENPVLGYELKPSSKFVNGDRVLRINRFGIRDDSDELFDEKRKLAILGDSVVFGMGHTQEETIPGRVQQQIDPDGERVKVLNFSVAGYAITQLLVQLQEKNRIYDVDDVVYLLNFNDFARHDSVYEGADNGNFRIYVRPTFMSAFFVRKAVYRMQKGDRFGSERWYRWFYNGNEERGQTLLSDMARYGRDEGFRFGVVLLPSGLSYSEHGYGLRDIHERGHDVACDLQPLLQGAVRHRDAIER